MAVLLHADDWDRLLAVLDWFVANPRLGLYMRQLDIPGVDTKFIEARRGILAELLDAVLPEQAVDRSAVGVAQFNRRYGLRTEPPAIRFRFLDPELYIQGMSDIVVPPEQFAGLRPPVERVFITENRINGLAFPDVPRSLVVFGLGYGLDRLADIDWLHHVGRVVLGRHRHPRLRHPQPPAGGAAPCTVLFDGSGNPGSPPRPVGHGACGQAV